MPKNIKLVAGEWYDEFSITLTPSELFPQADPQTNQTDADLDPDPW